MTAAAESEAIPISAAFFCAQAAAPDDEYLNGLHSFLSQHQHGRLLLQQISDLKHSHLWSAFAAASRDVASLKPGSQYLDILCDWASTGISGPMSAARSGAVALPLLVIVQIAQYLQYLDHNNLTHEAFLDGVGRAGGLQGFCGGLATAMAISCAADEADLIQHTCTAIRIAMAVGAFAEAVDDTRGTASTTLALRLRYEGQGEELTPSFPGTYISAVSDPRSISIVGPATILDELLTFARDKEGLQVMKMDIRGKVHNPENTGVAAELCALCNERPDLQLPDASKLRVAVRSNKSGEKLVEGSLSKELVTTILLSRCDWYSVLLETAKELKATGLDAPKLVCFGLTDALSLTAFHQQGLRPLKVAALNLIPRIPSVVGSQSIKANHQGGRSEERRNIGYTYPEKAVAIVGASARLPGADNLHELWEVLSKGEDKHEKLKHRLDMHSRFRVSQSGSATKDREFYGNFIDGVDRFDHAFFGINAREMVNMDPQLRVLLELSYEAMESSGYTRTHVRSRGDDVGCFIGASYTEYLENTNSHPPTAYTATGTIRAFLCGRLSYYYGWTGPAEVIDTACSASLVAVNRAIKSIQAGECSMALAGGVNLITGANNFLDLSKAGFLSPTGQCKPFDKDGDGYCRADGAGLIVLKSLRQAQLDGDHIMGVVAGASTNQGGLSHGLTVPSSDAQIKLYRSVVEQAGMIPDQVTYVEAHGTGTQAGDPLEIASVREVFGNPKRTHELNIGSLKGNIGHSETAAGIAGVLKVICMLDHQAIPPQASHRAWNPKIPALGPDRIALPTRLVPWEAPFRAALVNSYGAAGSNAAIVVCEAPAKKIQSDEKSIMNQGTTTQWPIIISAKTTSSLARYKAALARYLTNKAGHQPAITSIARTLSERRQQHKHYAVIRASSTSQLVKSLTDDDESKVPTLEHRDAPKAIVLTFGGQSKQSIGLDRSFYDNFVDLRTTLNQCNDILLELGYSPIIPAIFDSANISDIVALQTGHVAVQYAMATTWMCAGLKVDAVIGHSLGELTALAVSGILSIRNCLKLVAARADLMKTKWGPDSGSMLAVFSTRDVVHESLKDTGLEVACYNSDTSQVVTGKTQAIADLEQSLSTRSPPIKTLRVDTSHGFHSRLLQPVLESLDRVSAELEWKEPEIRIEFCSETPTRPGNPYSPSKHARDPVFWADAVRRLEQTFGECVFLEAGINTPVISMTKRAVARPQDHGFIALPPKTDNKAAAGDASDIISNTVCELWKSSAQVTHWSFAEPDCGADYIWLPPYQFDPTTAWLENVDRAAILQSQMDLIEAAGTKPNSEQQPGEEKANMVTLLPNTDESSDKTTHRFGVLVEGLRFRTIVAGHAVRNRPLCPASVYLECVTMALNILAGDAPDCLLDFQGLEIQAGLGLGAEAVHVVLHETGIPGCWDYRVVSLGFDSATKETLHARGRVTRSLDSRNLETLGRLMGNRTDTLQTDAAAERMLSRRAYSLFSRVVTYAPILRGISSITISPSGTEASAEIVTPPGQPGLAESTAVQTCDAVVLDSFIQVVGFLMNTSDMLSDEQVMICTGIESTMIAKNTNFMVGDDNRTWKVLASFASCGANQALGDVFAFGQDGSLAAVFTGCRFVKLDIARLERLLGGSSVPADSHSGAGESARPSPPARLSVPASQASSSDASTIDKTTPSTDDSRSSSGERSSVASSNDTVRRVLGTYTGLAITSIPGDVVLGDLGLDSLAAIEMAEELGSSHGIAINGTDLLNSSVVQLEERIFGSS